MSDRRAMIQADHLLAVTRRCALLDVARSTVYYRPTGISAEDLALMRLLDEIRLERPFYGSRRLRDELETQGHPVNRKRVQRLVRQMGLCALYPKLRTSQPAVGHTVYPYLLRGLSIERPNQVWAPDICYIPMAHGFMYLVAILDWYSRRVLAWRVSNTFDSDFCVEALEDALTRYGPPEIFNTDQGAQFTSKAFTTVLKTHAVPSAWTARAAGSTTCSSSGSGVRSNMSRSIWLSTPPPQMPGRASAGGSSSTTSGGRTRRSWTGRPTRRTLWGLLRDRGVTPPHHSPRRPDL